MMMMMMKLIQDKEEDIYWTHGGEICIITIHNTTQDIYIHYKGASSDGF